MRPRTLRNNKGFTLIELMIVVVIIGILAALAIPRFSNASARAKEKEADGVLKQVYTMQMAYWAQHSRYGTLTELEGVGYQTPVGLTHFGQPTGAAASATWTDITMTRSGTGYCSRRVDSTGNIVSVAPCN